MRKVLIVLLSFFVVSLGACLKDTPSTDLSHEGPIIEVVYPAGAQNNGVGSGLEYFSGGTLLFNPSDSSDTVTYFVNIAGTNTLNKPITVTMSIDTTLMQDNFGTDGITYIPFPDSDFSILNSTGVIPAGKRLDTFRVVFYPYKYQNYLTQNYSLPLKLTVSDGYTVAANFGKLYLHTVGNPIAGVYNQEWIRYNNAAGTGVPAYDQQIGPSIIAPVNGTTDRATSGSAGLIYIITFSDSSGVLTNFNVTFDPNSVKASGVSITSGPTITADPINKKYILQFNYNNSAGSPRNITDIFSKG